MQKLSRRALIVVHTGLFYGLQLALLLYWHSLASNQMRGLDTLITVAIAVVLAVVDAGAARYLLQALKRSEQVYAAGVSASLEESLTSYRALAEQERALAEEVGRAVEQELSEARTALAAGDFAEVDTHLQTGLAEASRTHAPYCEHVAVAAVLETKVRQCNEAGVTLDPYVSLPEELTLPDVEVAALFFNLIDNALHECESLAADGAEDLHIPVRGNVQAGQLFVQVTNPCRTGADARKHARERRKATGGQHGWGTDIVRTIARDHNGIAELGEKDGLFTAQVMIPLPEAAEA